MVEVEMLRDLIARITQADLRELHAHIQAEREAVQRIDVPTRTKLLFDFHVKLAQVLGNQVLTDLMQELVSRCSLISLMYQSADDAETSNAEHVDILQAIEAPRCRPRRAVAARPPGRRGAPTDRAPAHTGPALVRPQSTPT